MKKGHSMTARLFRSFVIASALVLCAVGGSAAAPEGQLTWGVHFSLAPTWLDPADTPAMITPFLTLYALHDAVAKPMPGNPMAPSLAESWTVSKDGLVSSSCCAGTCGSTTATCCTRTT